MHFKIKKSFLLILAITAIAYARGVFAFFHDPEGPNLLVVVGMAAAIYLLSLTVYLSNAFSSLAGLKRISVTIFLQLLIATCFCFLLR